MTSKSVTFSCFLFFFLSFFPSWSTFSTCRLLPKPCFWIPSLSHTHGHGIADHASFWDRRVGPEESGMIEEFLTGRDPSVFLVFKKFLVNKFQVVLKQVFNPIMTQERNTVHYDASARFQNDLRLLLDEVFYTLWVWARAYGSTMHVSNNT